jgi:tetratricopeptide (TPR) repeat protein
LSSCQVSGYSQNEFGLPGSVEMKSEQTTVESQVNADFLDNWGASGSIGERKRAQYLLTRLSQEDPNNERAWLGLAALATDLPSTRSFLRRALQINPRNRQALARLRQVEAQMASSGHQDPAPAAVTGRCDTAALAPQDQRSQVLRWQVGRWLVAAALLLIAGLLVFQVWAPRDGGGSSWAQMPAVTPSPSATATPTNIPTPSVPELVAERLPGLEHAWQERDWKTAANLLTDISALDGSYPGLGTARCDTLLHWASDLTEQGDIEGAYALYRQAYSLCEDTALVQDKKSLALNYLAGKWRHDRQRWSEAVSPLRAVYEADPEYAETRSMLYTSYLASAQALLAANQLPQARTACESALEVKPGDPEAAALLEEIRVKLIPTPTPTPANPLGKRIEVNISQQRMYVWQGDTLLYNWVCSTGEPGRNTAAGNFRVLDKIPEAWASTWSLRMPYWLGIYYAGSLENGIHALPILPNGQILWAGYLGSPVSFGCVILSTENARTLYEWADVGTPVWIHY